MLFGLFKKQSVPTCKKCGMVAVGLNAAGLCATCGKGTTVNTSLDNYNILKANICCVCWDKTAVADDYDLCDRCKATPITGKTAIFHIAQLFKLRHTEAIQCYENDIATAFDDDPDRVKDIAQEYINYCLSFGVPGQLYLTKKRTDLEKTTYEEDTIGYALQVALKNI